LRPLLAYNIHNQKFRRRYRDYPLKVTIGTFIPRLGDPAFLALAELNKVQSDQQAEETRLAASRAAFNEECRQQALSKPADPQKHRVHITRSEEKIIGLKSIVASAEATFNAAATERSAAHAELEQENERQRFAAIQRRFDDAREGRSRCAGRV